MPFTRIKAEQYAPYSEMLSQTGSGIAVSGNFTNANVSIIGGMIVAASNGSAGGGGGTVYDSIGMSISSEATITTGVKGVKQIAYNSQVLNWTILTDITGTINYTLEKINVTGYPSFTNMIGTGTPMKSNNAVYNQSTNLNGWTSVSFASGDLIRFGVSGVTGNIMDASLFITIGSI